MHAIYIISNTEDTVVSVIYGRLYYQMLLNVLA